MSGCEQSINSSAKADTLPAEWFLEVESSARILEEITEKARSWAAKAGGSRTSSRSSRDKGGLRIMLNLKIPPNAHRAGSSELPDGPGGRWPLNGVQCRQPPRRSGFGGRTVELALTEQLNII